MNIFSIVASSDVGIANVFVVLEATMIAATQSGMPSPGQPADYRIACVGADSIRILPAQNRLRPITVAVARNVLACFTEVADWCFAPFVHLPQSRHNARRFSDWDWGLN